MKMRNIILMTNNISFTSLFDKPIVFLKDVPYVIQGFSDSLLEVLKDTFFIVRNKI